jgi:hypothetical protein
MIKTTVQIAGKPCDISYEKSLTKDNKDFYSINILTESFRSIAPKILVWQSEGKYVCTPSNSEINDMVRKIIPAITK